MRVLRRADDGRAAGLKWLRLLPLDRSGVGILFEWRADPPPDIGDVFEIAAEVGGRWTGSPGFAVYADWAVAPEGDRAAFENSRRALFSLRADNIDTFHTDYLLRRADNENRLTVLGLYGDEAGVDLARGHPEIQEWAQANAPAQWGARDVSGLKLYRVAEQFGF